MSAVPGLSLRTTLAHIMERSTHGVTPVTVFYDRLADAILADRRLVVALRQDTHEGWLDEYAGNDWEVREFPETPAALRVLVVPVNPPEANDA